MAILTTSRAITKGLSLHRFPPEWAVEWGEDIFGVWATLVSRDVPQVFRWITPGEFKMGDRGSEQPYDVHLTRGLWLAETTVTQKLWQTVMGENPSHFQGEDLPVDRVSWHDAQAFMNTLEEKLPGLALRLPTEAEWEYACRAGTETPFSFGDQITTDQMNYDGNHPYGGGEKGVYRERTVPVKALPCNAWGLYQMHGNVWEWCEDWYGDYPKGEAVDPRGPDDGQYRVLRGGSWYSLARYARSAYRDHDEPGYRSSSIGFRLARGL